MFGTIKKIYSKMIAVEGEDWESPLVASSLDTAFSSFCTVLSLGSFYLSLPWSTIQLLRNTNE